MEREAGEEIKQYWQLAGVAVGYEGSCNRDRVGMKNLSFIFFARSVAFVLTMDAMF